MDRCYHRETASHQQPDLVVGGGSPKKPPMQDYRSSRRANTIPQADYSPAPVHPREPPRTPSMRNSQALQRSASVTPAREAKEPQRRTSSLRTRNDYQNDKSNPTDNYTPFCPEDGCLVLGREGLAFASYITRYCIDREEQQRKVSTEAAMGGCFPCCTTDDQQTPMEFVLRCFISEAFLSASHLTVLLAGIIRILAMPPSDHQVFHSVVSSLEMILTSTHLLARFGLVKAMFNRVWSDMAKLEYIEEGLPPKGNDLRSWLWTYTILSALAILVNITTYVILHLVQEQRWTLLTNAVLLLAFTATSRIFIARIEKHSNEMHKDHIRIALYEGNLLLREGLLGTRNFREHRSRVDSFLNALKATKFLKKPSHIHLMKRHADEWESQHSTQMEPVTSC